MVQGFDNIGICTTDLTRSVEFYKKLRFSEAYRNDRGVMMAAGSVQLFLFQTRKPAPALVVRELGLFSNPPGLDHISFAVTDVDALYAELCKAGVLCAGPPEDQSWGARMVALKDPDGNNLSPAAALGRCESVAIAHFPARGGLSHSPPILDRAKETGYFSDDPHAASIGSSGKGAFPRAGIEDYFEDTIASS